MYLVLRHEWEVVELDAVGRQQRAVLAAGRYEVERRIVWRGKKQTTWLMVKGGNVGAPEWYWRSLSRLPWEEFRVILEED